MQAGFPGMLLVALLVAWSPPVTAAEEPGRHLVVLYRQMQELLAERLLQPDASLLEAHAEFLEGRDTGLIRLLDRRVLGGTPLLPMRESGACYAFVPRGHDYDLHADLGLEGAVLRTSFVAGDRGLLVDLGLRSLDGLTLAGAQAPVELPPRMRRLWQLIAGTELAGSPRPGPGPEALEQAGVTDRADCVTGHTYLLRTHVAPERDTLVLLEILGRDTYGIDVRWQVLRSSQPVATRPWAPPPVLTPAEATPVWLRNLSTPALIEAARRYRTQQGEQLLSVSASVAVRYAELLARPDTGHVRLVAFPGHEAIMDRPGSAYSFATHSHTQDRNVDLRLAPGRFSAGFTTIHLGILMALGETPLARVAAGPPPSTVSPEDVVTWQMLWAPLGKTAEERRSAHEERTQWARHRRVTSAPVATGQTYLLRSAVAGVHDLLVALHVAAVDELGLDLVYRVLHRLESPPPK